MFDDILGPLERLDPSDEVTVRVGWLMELVSACEDEIQSLRDTIALLPHEVDEVNERVIARLMVELPEMIAGVMGSGGEVSR